MDKKIEIKPLKVDPGFADDLETWLQTKSGELNSAEIYLLSFHDDGVVWGKIRGEELVTSDKDLSDTPSPSFRSSTLQELRLFGENGQLHIWRIGEGRFKASRALDSETGEYEFLQDEHQVLWGTKTENDNDVDREFSIVADGSEGLRHAFPQKVSFKGDKRPLRLHVRHYIEYDSDGCARIAFSRLVNVSVEYF